MAGDAEVVRADDERRLRIVGIRGERAFGGEERSMLPSIVGRPVLPVTRGTLALPAVLCDVAVGRREVTVVVVRRVAALAGSRVGGLVRREDGELRPPPALAHGGEPRLAVVAASAVLCARRGPVRLGAAALDTDV
jgi:hypothetical protein